MSLEQCTPDAGRLAFDELVRALTDELTTIPACATARRVNLLGEETKSDPIAERYDAARLLSAAGADEAGAAALETASPRKTQ